MFEGLIICVFPCFFTDIFFQKYGCTYENMLVRPPWLRVNKRAGVQGQPSDWRRTPQFSFHSPQRHVFSVLWWESHQEEHQLSTLVICFHTQCNILISYNYWGLSSIHSKYPVVSASLNILPLLFLVKMGNWQCVVRFYTSTICRSICHLTLVFRIGFWNPFYFSPKMIYSYFYFRCSRMKFVFIFQNLFVLT